ncbi:5-methyltetrahydropteroyltriglutamate--homocysteine S-methyltransferase [Bradyrhizobium sp. CCGE-LA001]|uniref:5-methyltetrahydropteroyltriglutamate-- homocysteine S-methyltransferase n=1 Tax=Bradyrhizobium sp. CCGE-LA001 TaxID=1223566 RepID=UPI000745B2C0|nr:5-methyltetrahydropteroyltriglutamate--homocysteine S-methyltransferase [Bradyrhizobium sp. CCGE-LA001]AMA59881.1 5-methyltetrahydropteroyltriglutamate--homocysteine methyltransferase [Bradyrhizobium sp. CCGE-LA001]
MSNISLPVATLGMPRIGPRRELKFALESYWAGKSSEAQLLEAAAGLRLANWARQRSLGATIIPSNDFSLYDHVLDTSVMVGAIPDVYGWDAGPVSLKTYFTMARGAGDGQDAGLAHADDRHGPAAQEMTKWFDTNYHYMVPEFRKDQTFELSSRKPIEEYEEAKSLGYQTRCVLIGPVTFLKLGKSADPAFNPLLLLDQLLPVYVDVLRELAAQGAEWVQLDEPCLVLDLDESSRGALRRVYAHFAKAVPGLKIMLATYFGSLADNLDTALALPIAGLHVDLVRASDQLNAITEVARSDLVLSLGVIDGRNVWRCNLQELFDRLAPAIAKLGRDRVEIAPSCSLLHIPVDLDLENHLDHDVKNWLAFSVQKIKELTTLGSALAGNQARASRLLAASRRAAGARQRSSKINNPNVTGRLAAIDQTMHCRRSSYATRTELQRARLALPVFPTTTIGSFPQTAYIRSARASHAQGKLSDAQYDQLLKAETARAVRWQEEIGLDVLVHGEFERNDMVQYFGERLSGFAFTKHGWVQSYGSRCVRPPILFGDVSRPNPMTVDCWSYAQSLTKKPVKAMLTGPVTILNWSFVREDILRSEVCLQIALAIQDEVVDLQNAGAKIIQIDEAALREGLPLRKSQWKRYLDWAVNGFRICSSVAADETQIHTHMCYSEFNDIIDAIAEMDADVISIETSRSKMELLDAFRSHKYPNQIGPGVYDIHSPRVPETAEMKNLITLARQQLSDCQLWINPDCGLKTRKWEEVRPALVNMVAAARELRAALIAQR